MAKIAWLKQTFAFALSLATFSSLSQNPASSSGYSGSSGGAAIMSDEFRLNLPSEGKMEDVQFFQLLYRTTTLDLRSLKRYTKHQIPESVVIVPPDLSSYQTITVLVGVFGAVENPKMIIWLAGNYHRNDITFFIDYDQDRNFVNDKGPVKMRRGNDPREVLLTPMGGTQKLLLSVPREKVGPRKAKKRIDNVVVVSLHAGAGTGDLTYSDLVYDYYVNISEKSVGTSVSYYFRNFVLGVTANFQNHYHYASYNRATGGGAGGVNRDLHPPNKLQVSVSGAYRIFLGRLTELQPEFKFGVASYLKPEYKLNRYSDQIFDLERSPFYEIGAKLEFTVGIESAFFVEFAVNRQRWEPIGLAVSERFESKLKISKFNVGYKFSIL